MRNISSALQVARNVLHSSDAFLFCVEVPCVAGGFYRLVKNSRHLTVGSKTFSAASIEINIPDEVSDGSLSEGSITIPNVSRLPMAAVEIDGELRGQTITWWLVSTADVSALPAGLSWRQTILTAIATERTMTLECGHAANIRKVPGRIFDRTKFRQLLPVGGR